MPETPLSFFSSTSGRATAIAVGFRFGHIGTHTSRTIMLNELGATLQSVPVGSGQEAYPDAIIQDNCLSKPTATTRRLSFQRLRELYALTPSVPIFRILRRLWEVDPEGRPLLALLVSLARDPILLATAQVIIRMPVNTEFQRTAMRDALTEVVQDRLNDSTLNTVVRNTASSWTQTGHLDGRTFKFRRLVRATPPSVAFALYLAHAAGFPARESLNSGWLKVLDCDVSASLDIAAAAKRMGLLDLRVGGGIIDLEFDRLDPFQPVNQQLR
jgi:hypothetical protein